MSNPTGSNSLFISEPKYGDVKRQAEQLRAAPMAGATNVRGAMNTPRRSQKQTQRPQQQAATPAPMPSAAAPPPPSTAAVWQQIAQIPGASPLVLEMAQRAQGG